MLLEPAPSANDRSAEEADEAIQDGPQPSAEETADASDASDAFGVEQSDAADPDDGSAIEEAIQDVLNEIEHLDYVEKAEQRPQKQRVAFKAVEIAEQVFQVQEWLSAGVRPNVIRKLCSEEWGLSTRVSELRMQEARRKMVTDANVYDRTEKVGQMLQQLEKVLEDALKMRQGSNAIGAIRLQADLLQLLTRQN